MNKWGVRLISVFLFTWAISDLYNLITGNELIGVFIGYDLGLNRDGIPIQIMAWVEALILVYAGVQVLRFRSSGRYGALIVLLLYTIKFGGWLMWMTIITAYSFIDSEFRFSFSLVDGIGPITFLFGAAIMFVYYFIPTYYLMRKGVKQLFEKSVATEETATIPSGEKS